MVDSYTSIVLKRLPKVIPKCEVSYFAHVQRPERIRVANTQHRTIAVSRLRLKQGIVLPRRRLVAVDVLRNYVEIAADESRHTVLFPSNHLLSQPIHPS